jgi:hypothetical protein
LEEGKELTSGREEKEEWEEADVSLRMKIRVMEERREVPMIMS